MELNDMIKEFYYLLKKEYQMDFDPIIKKPRRSTYPWRWILPEKEGLYRSSRGMSKIVVSSDIGKDIFYGIHIEKGGKSTSDWEDHDILKSNWSWHKFLVLLENGVLESTIHSMADCEIKINFGPHDMKINTSGINKKEIDFHLNLIKSVIKKYNLENKNDWVNVFIGYSIKKIVNRSIKDYFANIKPLISSFFINDNIK